MQAKAAISTLAHLDMDDDDSNNSSSEPDNDSNISASLIDGQVYSNEEGDSDSSWLKGLGVWKYIQPHAAHLYILIYSVQGYIWEMLKGIINYIYMIIGILSDIIGP